MTTAAFIMVFIVPPIAVFFFGWWAVRRQEAELAAAGGSVPGGTGAASEARAQAEQSDFASWLTEGQQEAQRTASDSPHGKPDLEELKPDLEQLLRTVERLMRQRQAPVSGEEVRRIAAGQPSPSEDQRSDTPRQGDQVG